MIEMGDLLALGVTIFLFIPMAVILGWGTMFGFLYAVKGELYAVNGDNGDVSLFKLLLVYVFILALNMAMEWCITSIIMEAVS